jgi:hypothetical protein
METSARFSVRGSLLLPSVRGSIPPPPASTSQELEKVELSGPTSKGSTQGSTGAGSMGASLRSFWFSEGECPAAFQAPGSRSRSPCRGSRLVRPDDQEKDMEGPEPCAT